jgi:hypothetical protein
MIASRTRPQSVRRTGVRARSAALSLAGSLTDIAEASMRATRAYRHSGTLQMERDWVGVLKLSAKTTAVLDAEHWALRKMTIRNPCRGVARDRFSAAPSSIRCAPAPACTAEAKLPESTASRSGPNAPV